MPFHKAEAGAHAVGVHRVVAQRHASSTTHQQDIQVTLMPTPNLSLDPDASPADRSPAALTRRPLGAG